jgi:hypothetical protein
MAQAGTRPPEAAHPAAGSDWGARRRLAWQSPRLWPVLLAAVALLLASIGLRGSIPRVALDGPLRQNGILTGSVLEAVLAASLVVLILRRRSAAGYRAARLRGLLAYLAVAGLVTIPALELLSLHVHPVRRVRRPALPVPSRPRIPLAHSGQPAWTATAWSAFAVVLLVVTAAVLGYLLLTKVPWRRLLRRRAALRLPVPPLLLADEGERDDELREAAQLGRLALRGTDDTRAAIIACYAAMEQSLARAGAERGIAGTPDELLARAAGAGLIRGTAAGALTALFYEARFSSHPMPRSDRDTAESALAEVIAGGTT